MYCIHTCDVGSYLKCISFLTEIYKYKTYTCEPVEFYENHCAFGPNLKVATTDVSGSIGFTLIQAVVFILNGFAVKNPYLPLLTLVFPNLSKTNLKIYLSFKLKKNQGKC